MRTLKVTLLLILGLILLLFCTFEIIDIYAIGHNISQKAAFAMKFCVSVLCATVAFLIPKDDALSTKDYKLIKTSFGFIVLADFLLVLLQNFLSDKYHDLINGIGIGVFMIVQTLLIIRHATGIRSDKEHHSHMRFKCISALSIYIPGIVAVLILHSLMSEKMLIEISIYAAMVTTSTWFGVNTLTRDTFPKRNRTLIAAGMLFFLCCDISVGVMTFGPTLASKIATSVVYVFYTPALLLLAFSGYKNQPLLYNSK